MLDLQFYVGPIGGLQPLPGTWGTVDTPLSVAGGTHTSLSGVFTRDILGFKRSWSWTFPGLTLAEVQWVEALQRNMIPGPLYLLDPRRPNRLPEQIASGGSLRKTSEGFIPGNTAVCIWRPMTYINTADLSTLPPAPLLAGALEWQLLASGAQSLELAGPASDGRLDVAVLPSDVLAVSTYAVGPSGAVLTMTATAYDAGANVVATAASSATSLAPAAWTQLATTITCPSTAAKLRLTFATAAGTPTGSIYLTAMQVAAVDGESVPRLTSYCVDDLTGGWRLGGGVTQVVPDAGSGSSGGNASYAYPGLSAMTLTLIERN